MCGIAGFNWPDKLAVERMNKSIKHRGPDDEGTFVDRHVSLGNVRLAVMDTSDRGHQPMQYEHLVIVYNGEVYNFLELRAELELQGYKFNSDTDTEVLLYSYHRWGPACVERFNGMWAFCIYDSKKRTLFLSRDRFGVKPLYYYFDGRRFAFASELKAIRELDLNLTMSTAAVNYFFYQKYIGEDRTIYENCCKLRPSENLLFDLDAAKLTLTKYFDLEQRIAEEQTRNLQQRIDSIENLIIDSVEKRLVADVPVGSFLSGGLDSSLISAVIMRKHKQFDTFSIGFRDATYDELEYSNLVSDHIGTAHYYEYMEISEDIIREVLAKMCEPFGDSSIFPTYLLCKITRRHVTAALSGDGGDELFGGYDTYKAFKIARYVPRAAMALFRLVVNRLPPTDKKTSLTFKMKRFVRQLDANVCKRHLNWMATFNNLQRRKLLGERFISADEFMSWSSERSLLSVQLNDVHNYLAEDILKKVDMASMLNSLEARVPFLDHRLVPLVLSLPDRYKLRGLKTKWLLKTIGSKYLPESIVHRPKKGFTAPVSAWIRKYDFIRNYLTEKRYFEHDYINFAHVKGLFDEHIQRKDDNARHLWLVFVFNYWMSEVNR